MNKSKDNKILELQKNINKLKYEQSIKENEYNILYINMKEKDNKIKNLEEYKIKYDKLKRKNDELNNDNYKLKESLNSLEKLNQSINKKNEDLNQRIKEITNNQRRNEEINENHMNYHNSNREIYRLNENDNYTSNRLFQSQNNFMNLIQNREDSDEIQESQSFQNNYRSNQSQINKSTNNFNKLKRL